MTQADPPYGSVVERLDPVAAEALRRLDAIVGDRVSPPVHADVVVDFLAGEVLSRGDVPDVVTGAGGTAAEDLLAALAGVLLVEMSRRQGNRPHSGARHLAD